MLDCRLERLREAAQLRELTAAGGTLIARGAGRSYGDAALNPDLTLSMLAMNRMQAFDPATGLLACESGVLLADILETFVPRGWFPPVVPGTGFVTVGGMIAADVHGRNHYRDGSFGAHVEGVDAGVGRRRDPRVQPHRERRPVPRHRGWPGPDRRDPVGARAPAADHHRLRHAGDAGRA